MGRYFGDARQGFTHSLSASLLLLTIGTHALGQDSFAGQFEIVQPYDWLHSKAGSFFEAAGCSVPVEIDTRQPISRSRLRSAVLSCISKTKFSPQEGYQGFYKDLLTQTHSSSGNLSQSNNSSSQPAGDLEGLKELEGHKKSLPSSHSPKVSEIQSPQTDSTSVSTGVSDQPEIETLDVRSSISSDVDKSPATRSIPGSSELINEAEAQSSASSNTKTVEADTAVVQEPVIEQPRVLITEVLIEGIEDQ